MGQIFIIPVCLILGSFIGVVVTSCAGETRPSFVTSSSSVDPVPPLTSHSPAGFYPDEGLLWLVVLFHNFSLLSTSFPDQLRPSLSSTGDPTS